MCAPAVPGLPQPGRTLVIGVVNVTPDSFSDGGEWFDPEAAIAHGRDLIGQGADIVEVGGESTRPGAVRPPVTEELRRVLPVIRALAGAGCVSVDTMRAEVAAAAIEAGARLVNDVSGGRADPAMLPLLAEAGLPYICMHWRGHSEDMQSRAVYADVVGRGGRRAHRAGRRGRASRDRAGAADHRPRPRVRQDRRAQLGAAAAADEIEAARAGRCSSACRERRSSARCWPTRTASRARRSSGTTPPQR